MSTPNQPVRSRSRLRVTAFGLAVLAFGLLLWGRFILVTNHPRTAIADPAAAVEHVQIDK